MDFALRPPRPKREFKRKPKDKKSANTLLNANVSVDTNVPVTTIDLATASEPIDLAPAEQTPTEQVPVTDASPTTQAT